MFNVTAQQRSANERVGYRPEATKNPKVFYSKFFVGACNCNVMMTHKCKLKKMMVSLHERKTHVYANRPLPGRQLL